MSWGCVFKFNSVLFIYGLISFFYSTRFTECISCEHILGNRINTEDPKKCESSTKCIYTVASQFLFAILPFARVTLAFIWAGPTFERISHYITFRLNFMVVSIDNLYKVYKFLWPLCIAWCVLRVVSCQHMAPCVSGVNLSLSYMMCFAELENTCHESN